MRLDTIKLISEMRARDLNQKRLSELSGVNRVTISNILRGCTCSEMTAAKIAAALRVKTDELS